MSEPQQPVAIFYAYAPEDTSWALELEKHLTLLQRQHLITTWHARLIRAGEDWQQVVNEHLQHASVILLLISPDFLASDYCYSTEMRQALEREQTKGVRVVPILLRPVHWQDAPFAYLHPLPSDATFLTEWANIDRAFAEITAGLRRTLEDLFLLALQKPQDTTAPLWNVPFARNPFFLGQGTLLALLHQHFQEAGAGKVSSAQAITGLGGIGKTQLVIEYAYRFRLEYQAIFWIHAESTETLYASYAELARMLTLPEANDLKQDTVVQGVKHWLQTHERWLLILDNADEPDLAVPFLPALLCGHVLLTTRATALRRLGIAHVLSLDSLPPAQAALLLLRRAGLLLPDAPLEQATDEEQQQAFQLAQEMGGLPLAIDQAGAYLEATGMTLAAYQDIYQHYQADLLAEHRGQEQYHPEPVATTWQLAFQKVEARNPAAAALLHLCAFLHPEAIDEILLTQGKDELGPVLSPVVSNRYLFEKAFETLRAYSLVARDARHQQLSMHRLVQSVVRASLSLEDQLLWQQRVIALLASAFPSAIEVINWERCERLLPHVFLTTQWGQEKPSLETSTLAYLLNQAGYFLTRRARFAEARPFLQQALEIRERLFGREGAETAQSIHNLAELFSAQGEYVQAVAFYEQALAIRRRVLGEQHLETAQTMMTLGRLYREQGHYEQARPLLEQVLTMRIAMLGKAHPETARSLQHLAYLERKQGRYPEAEQLLLRALAIWKEVREPEHPDSVQTLNTLAGLYREQGRYLEAEPLARQALAIWERVLGPDHPTLLRSVNNLAGIARELGQYEQARPLYERVLAARERSLGPEHPETAQALNNLAGLLQEQERWEKARQLYERALRIRQRILGPEHQLTTQTLHNLARISLAQGHLEEAEALATQVATIRQRHLGEEHPGTLRSLSQLGQIYSTQQRFAEAEELLQRVLSIQERVFGPEHPDTLRSLGRLGSLASTRGQAEQAEELLQRVLSIQERVFGPEHPALLNPLRSLVALYLHQQRENDALPLAQRLQVLEARLLGPEQLNTQTT